MTTQTVVNLGELGTTSGVLKPLVLPLLRGGAAWDLSAYTDPRLEAWDLRTRTAIAGAATVTIVGAAVDGEVQVVPLAPFWAASGTYEGRIWVSPDGGVTEEPSGLFRWSIAGGAHP